MSNKCLLALVLGTLIAPASALDIQGRVSAAGQPLAGVLVTAEDRESGDNDNPASVSAFSDSAGRFVLPGLIHARAAQVTLRTHKIGYRQAAQEWDAAQSGQPLTVNLRLAAVDNVADQVPASAWLARFPLDERGARFVAGQCAGCHQFPSRQVQRFASSLASLGEAEKQERWTEATRQENERLKERVWRGAVQTMRGLALRFSADSPVRWGIDEKHPEYAKLMTADFSLFNQEEETAGAAALARYLGSDFSTFSLADYPAAATPLAATAKTRITEYALHTGGWTREIAWTPAGGQLWLVEDDADRIARLDPKTGRLRWIDLPGSSQHPQGPHTINADREGNIWLSLEESYAIARLDPKTEQWRIYPGFGEFSIAHDACVDSDRYVAFDGKGRLWLTLIGQNELASLDPATGDIQRFPMPKKEGEAAFHAALYGCVMSADRKQVWFTQLNGIVGGFDVETGKLQTSLTFPLGTIPHRMAIDDGDVIYVALSGDGQVLAYDTRAGKELARHPLPDRNASPYALTWDPRRRVVWVAASNTDVIYRLNPADGAVSVLPLPRPRAFLRMIDLDRTSGDLWTTYAHLPINRGPNYAVRIEVGD
ncbi:PQQ-binding-like beta-propeller repeat protein [Immundisolibacter sp.]|uniref:outer membrane protein assembly factor BamB family protein n=2 Tax=Immundisolibacter sp. TaxID=1934948 RepID=UPI003567E477